MSQLNQYRLREVLLHGMTLLRSGNIDTPDLDASLILAWLLRVERSRLVLMWDHDISGETFQEYMNLMKRRIDGESVAYITGTKEFWGLPFKVNSSVLVPRPDTEILVEAALNWIRRSLQPKKHLCVIDVCTGSGAIAVALKHECPALSVEASDISEAALEVARYNIHRTEQSIYTKAICWIPFPGHLISSFQIRRTFPRKLFRHYQKKSKRNQYWLWTAARTVWTLSEI